MTVWLTADFSSKTKETRMQWYDIFKMLKEYDCQPRYRNPLKLSFKTSQEF